MRTTKDKGRERIAAEEQHKKRRVQRRRKRGKPLRFLLILFVLIYLPALWKWIFHGNIEKDILHTNILEIKIKSEGVFIRDEKPVVSPRDGIVIPRVDQGERVPNKYEFAIVVDNDSKRILSEIENLEKNIIRQFAENNPEILSGDSEFRNRVQSEVNKLTDVAVNKNFPAIEDIKASRKAALPENRRSLKAAETGSTWKTRKS